LRIFCSVFLLTLALGIGVPSVSPEPVLAQGPYRGPLIDAHSHLPNLQVLDAYVDAMKRNNVSKVVLLGVGGVQKDDPAWIAAAVRKYPDRVIPGLPLPDPTSKAAAARLDSELAKGNIRVIGEVHVRQVSRKIDFDPLHPPFGEVLEVSGRRRVPIVVHYEMEGGENHGFDVALAAHRSATIILAHGGSTKPERLEAFLTRNPNLVVDLSGMHFLRKPSLATETGSLDPGWKRMLEKFPDRFLMGLDVWAPRLFEPATLDRLIGWTRRILGELPPEVAEKVAYKNAARLFRIQ
jgi:predicted TIM-barrel fold metal-dependent hydrolase